ncbi:hypothetical protein TNCT_405991 [Trichonephila clavata]|uniref:Uncharacterized protein n=1 Tax=Trichonephila clavata TaxID=2740835 RepID=A0A8X6IBN9_TRICU|nr:hypothetical protein TNCT_405991 [Trichonephila clavata]
MKKQTEGNGGQCHLNGEHVSTGSKPGRCSDRENQWLKIAIVGKVDFFLCLRYGGQWMEASRASEQNVL